MQLLFSSPTFDDIIRLLRAWRFWLFAAILGGLISAAVFYILPPPYRARATVNVDFNLEQAWPQESNREQFYYLERESRKLVEIAWSDEVLQSVADADGQVTIGELRDGKLQLSQPGEAGWHFYADDDNAQRAETLASTWAQAFVESAQDNVGAEEGLTSFIRIELTQAAKLPKERRVPLSGYLLAGTVAAWFLGAFIVLFFHPGAKREEKK